MLLQLWLNIRICVSSYILIKPLVLSGWAGFLFRALIYNSDMVYQIFNYEFLMNKMRSSVLCFYGEDS